MPSQRCQASHYVPDARRQSEGHVDASGSSLALLVMVFAFTGEYDGKPFELDLGRPSIPMKRTSISGTSAAICILWYKLWKGEKNTTQSKRPHSSDASPM